MGIFCMVFGVVVFLGATIGGTILANNLVVAESSFYSGGPFVTFLGLPSDPLPYIVVIAFLGFLIGLSFFAKGLTLYRIGRLQERLNRINRRLADRD